MTADVRTMALPFIGVSTRMLLALALGTGLAILVAGAVQLFLLL